MIRPLVLAAVMLLTPPAYGHDWFTGKRDPQTQEGCCDGQDCKLVPAEMLTRGVVREVQGGFEITLTADDYRYFAPASAFAHNMVEVVPWSRVQPSQSNDFALCLHLGKVQCFFAPQTS